MVTLRIFLMGLVALVPSGKELTVVLPNASEHEHVAVLVWDPANNPEQGDGVEIQKKLGVARIPSGYLLDGERFLVPSPLIGGLEYAGGREAHSRRRLSAAMPRKRNHEDYSWVVSMEELTNGMGFIDPAYYSGTDKTKVSSRLHIRAGQVKTFSLGNDGGGNVKALRFVGVGRQSMLSARQAVADVVVVEIQFTDEELAKTGGKVVLTASSLEETKDEQGNPEHKERWKVELQPNAERRIDVLFGNLPPLTCPRPAPEPALHFEFYNSLLALRGSYVDRLLPRMGRASKPGDGLDPNPDRGPLPPVLAVVSEVSEDRCPKPRPSPTMESSPPAALSTSTDPSGFPFGSIARPICMITSFQAPTQ